MPRGSDRNREKSSFILVVVVHVRVAMEIDSYFIAPFFLIHVGESISTSQQRDAL